MTRYPFPVHYFLHFFLVLFCCSNIGVFAQSDYFIVSGKVIASDTKSPMFRATVFAENTTFATATDSNGNFRLGLPKGGYSLTFSFTGYSTQNIRVSSTDNSPVLMELSVKEKTMESVAVVSTGEVKNGWEKYGQKFLDEFIGKSPNSRNCVIKNPETVKFFFSKRKNRLKVLASDPLVIENNSLGYKITYELDSFVHEFNTEVSVYTGYPRFEELIDSGGTMKMKWDSARLDTYHGSVMHFMRACYDQHLKEESFELGFVSEVDGKDSLFKYMNGYTDLNYQKDSNEIVSISPAAPFIYLAGSPIQLGVLYTAEGPYAEYLKENADQPADLQFSVVLFPSERKLFIEKNGFYYEQNDLTFNQYWSWEKVADALPFNYVPLPK